MQESAGGPATLLITSGVLGLIYSLLCFVWTVPPVGWAAVVVYADIDKKGLSSDTIGMALMFMSVPVVQLACFALCTVLSVVALWGGLKYNRFESKGLVFLGLAASTAVPVIGVVGNMASTVNCGTCGAGFFGCLAGNAITMPVLIIGLIATVWGVVDLTGPRGDRFDAEGVH